MQPRATRRTENKPWGIIGTLGFSITSMLFFYAIQTILSFLYVYIKTSNNPNMSLIKGVTSLSSDNLSVLVTSLPASILTVLLIRLIIRKHKGLSVKKYLALQFPKPKQFAIWIGVFVLYSIITIVLEKILDRPVAESMIEAFRNASFLPLLLLSPVILAPIVEEIIFRGLLFKGFLNTRLGITGTVFLTSAMWTTIHIQYGAFDLFSIFISGLVFGYARAYTKSLYITILMHMLMNIIASVQLILLMG